MEHLESLFATDKQSRCGLKLLIGLAIILGVCVSKSTAQSAYEDVVYLKNGEIRRGKIIEEIPNKQLKIKTKDGNVFVYSYDSITRITKEKSFSSVHSSSKITRRNAKSPSIALLVSTIPGFVGINGGGQFYNGEMTKGVGFLFAGVITGGWYQYEFQKKGSDGSHFAVPLSLFLCNWLVSSVDAYISANRINEGITKSASSLTRRLVVNLHRSSRGYFGTLATVQF